jgi:hypothetical protein
MFFCIFNIIPSIFVIMAIGYQKFKCENCGVLFDTSKGGTFDKFGQGGTDFCSNNCYHVWAKNNPRIWHSKTNLNSDSQAPSSLREPSIFEQILVLFNSLSLILYLFIATVLFLVFALYATWWGILIYVGVCLVLIKEHHSES